MAAAETTAVQGREPSVPTTSHPAMTGTKSDPASNWSNETGANSPRERTVNRTEDDDEFDDGGIPGDVTTEPVASAEESARPGNNRVGPPTVAQDSTAEHYVPEGVTQLDPGQEYPAHTPRIGGPIELDTVMDEHGHDVSTHKSSDTKMAERE